MDTLAHGLWTYAITRAPKKQIQWFWPVFFAVLPDLIWLPSIVLGLVMGALGVSGIPPDTLFQHLYNVSHSLVIWLVVTAVISLALRQWFWPTWGWALHILIDMPGHLHSESTPFLWPLSSYRVTGAWNWLTPTWLIANYTILILVFLVLWWRHRSSKHTL